VELLFSMAEKQLHPGWRGEDAIGLFRVPGIVVPPFLSFFGETKEREGENGVEMQEAIS
jgi:hypothetical protein